MLSSKKITPFQERLLCESCADCWRVLNILATLTLVALTGAPPSSQSSTQLAIRPMLLLTFAPPRLFAHFSNVPSTRTFAIGQSICLHSLE